MLKEAHTHSSLGLPLRAQASKLYLPSQNCSFSRGFASLLSHPRVDGGVEMENSPPASVLIILKRVRTKGRVVGAHFRCANRGEDEQQSHF